MTVIMQMYSPPHNNFSSPLDGGNEKIIMCNIVVVLNIIIYKLSIPLQISYASALSSLSERSRFRSYFRITPNFNNYAPAIVSILNKFNWKRIAFLTQAENLFKKVCAITLTHSLTHTHTHTPMDY